MKPYQSVRAPADITKNYNSESTDDNNKKKAVELGGTLEH
jgi:hypothetical protein